MHVKRSCVLLLPSTRVAALECTQERDGRTQTQREWWGGSCAAAASGGQLQPCGLVSVAKQGRSGASACRGDAICLRHLCISQLCSSIKSGFGWVGERARAHGGGAAAAMQAPVPPNGSEPQFNPVRPNTLTPAPPRQPARQPVPHWHPPVALRMMPRSSSNPDPSPGAYLRSWSCARAWGVRVGGGDEAAEGAARGWVGTEAGTRLSAG